MKPLRGIKRQISRHKNKRERGYEGGVWMREEEKERRGKNRRGKNAYLE